MPSAAWIPGGLVFGDVREPELVRGLGGEHVPGPAVLVDDGAEVVVHGRSRSAGLAPLGFAERAEPAVGRRDPPRGPIRHGLAVVAGLVGEESMPELRVITMRVEQRVRAIRLHHLARGDGFASHR